MLRARAPVLLAVTAFATLLVVLPAPASAHADLLGAEPEPNTELDAAPTRLELRFSEPLEDRFTRVEVVDANGTDHVETFTIPSQERRTLEVSVGPLPDGIHTVEWRALSSADGHTTSGSYLLAVNATLGPTDPGGGDPGDPATAPSADAGRTSQVEEGGPGEAIARGLAFLGASLAVGVPLFLLVTRGLSVPEPVTKAWWTLAVAGAALAALASVGLLAALAGRTQLGFQAVLTTTPGQNLGLRALAFAGAAALLAAGARWREDEAGTAAAAVGAFTATAGLLLTSLGSHAAAQGVGTGLAIAVDWTHQAAVAFWVGGVAAVGLAGWRAPAEPCAELIRRFSPLAAASVVLIVATGTLASVDRLTTPGDLLASLYGFALSAKILLLVPLVALGAYHRYRLLPRLETGDEKQAEPRLLRRSAFLELGIMVVVLLAAGLMATTSPPTPLEQRTPFTTFDEAVAADRPGPFEPDLEHSELASLDEAEATNVTLHLLEPARIDRLDQGDQRVWLALADGTGERARPITDADVEIRAWMPAHGHGTSTETDPVHVNEGMYEGATHWLMPGAWELRFNVTLPEGDVLHYRPTVYVEEEADPLDQREPIHAVEDGGYAIEVFVSPEPVRVGVQNFTVRVTPEEQPALPENADVVVNLEAPSSSGGEGRNVDLERWREDAWTREDAIFTEQGTWSALVALQGKGTYVQTEFELDVGPP